MSTQWSCILFDLDGTILDSAPGITETLAYMFEKLERPVPSQARLLEYVGPPILDSFRDLAGMSPAQSLAALDVYRVRYLERGALGSTVYPGVERLLRQVHESPLPLSLATSKPELPATKMLNLAGLTRYFDVITGASEDEVRSSKADVVEEALQRLAGLGADISNPVMVGDREHDVAGASEHGVPTIFVNWGYGSHREASGAIATVDTTVELHSLLLG
jgi:phosphoglycolate phosphatase